MFQNNPYSVLLENISFENVQKMGEVITLKTLKAQSAYAHGAFHWLYVGLVKDLNRANDTRYVFSDAYDLVQSAICFLREFIGKKLDDVYMVKNGKNITIRKATYLLVSRHIQRTYQRYIRSCDIENYANQIPVEIDAYQEKDYSVVDEKMELLNLKPRDRVVVDCYMGGMTCYEIAKFLGIDRTTVWYRRRRAQVKYKALFC